MTPTASILTIGNELVSGDVPNTNASWLARRLAPLGVEVRMTAALPDEIDAVAAFVRTEAPRVDFLLVTGGLGADNVLRSATSLSPGERTRAGLALLTARGVNCLVLDEPTNHLDVEAIEELERGLAGYDGTVILVTHDRRFLEAFAPSRTIEL